MKKLGTLFRLEQRMTGQTPKRDTVANKFRRRRLTKVERSILITAYQKDPVWGKDTLQSLAEKIGVTQALIYKWHYDYRRLLKK